MKVDVLVLAGAPNDGSLQNYSEETHEALIKIGEIPMVEYVIRAAVNAKNTEKIVLVGPGHEMKDKYSSTVDILINSTDSMVDNIHKGVKALRQNNKYILLVTADIPLISAEIIDEYIDSCQNKQADLFFPVINKEICQSKFPEVQRTYVRLADGTYTGGNIIVVKPEVLLDILDLLKKVIIWRKKPWKLSKLLGFKFIIKFFLGALTLEEIETRVSEIIGYKGKGLVSQHPEIGFDVDKPSDLQLIRDKYFSLV